MKVLITAMLLLASSSLFADAFDNNLKELFVLTGIKNNYITANTVILNRMQRGYLQAADENISADGFTEEQKKKAGEILKARFNVMVKNYDIHITKVMPYEKVVEEVYLPLYKEVYTNDEVKELLVFYRSPIGQKLLDTTQELSNQSSERIATKYDPLVVPFMEAEIEENIAIVQKEIQAQIK